MGFGIASYATFPSYCGKVEITCEKPNHFIALAVVCFMKVHMWTRIVTNK